MLNEDIASDIKAKAQRGQRGYEDSPDFVPKIYNVAMTVVELISAKSPEESAQILRSRLQAAGFEVLELSGDVFESEEQ